ncbi:hypothetical protein NLM33_12110 [Bradyrhizobium sp. CCGUVB1N3]|uniref:hypothetical protein n=1 Tax=Bradyrhizobium sp. CCGUVB1N3 TaxID=2949629 RepID=UPI0020B33AF4|nr:hypothetical protein [Bradyrhizobium sp. CCGUVB1N3]MCP3471070.1 hypothetical protein [Bradyrhizobium sp. CCGUVB1N3]
MIYLTWSLPILAVVILMASGRVGAIGAGLIGAGIATLVALTAAPAPLTLPGIFLAVAAGLWRSWLVAAVILAGLFFRHVMETEQDGRGRPVIVHEMRRQKVFVACFLLGPFAETATGFGVGQVTTVGALRAAALSPVHVALLALFSQILVPWGAMANGTIIGAQLAALSPADLGTNSALVSVPLLLVWLVVFWRMAGEAGVSASSYLIHLQEAMWVLLVSVLLIIANQFLGPEIAGMAALGPVILLRFWRDEKPDRRRWLSALRIGLPYAALIVGFSATRMIPILRATLGNLAFQPFADGPTWVPLLHPGVWLASIGCLAALVARRSSKIASSARRAWSLGCKAASTVAVYLVIAQIMAESGIAKGLASGVQLLLGPWAVLAVPLIAGALGFLTGSSNAANGLLMPSQTSLAGSHVSLGSIAALQNTAAAAMTMLSPARVAMGCALVGRTDLELAVYRLAWPLAASALIALSCIAIALLSIP